MRRISDPMNRVDRHMDERLGVKPAYETDAQLNDTQRDAGEGGVALFDATGSTVRLVDRYGRELGFSGDVVTVAKNGKRTIVAIDAAASVHTHVYADLTYVAGLPTYTKQTGAGTTGSTASSTGVDEIGTIQLVPGGTGIATGAQVVVTFATARADSNFAVWISAGSQAARTAGTSVGPTARSTTGWTLTSDVALTSGSTYIWYYRLWNLP